MSKPAINGYTKVTSAEYREHEHPLLAKRVVQIGSNQQYRAEWDNSELLYEGYAANGLGADESGWLLRKYTYTNGEVTLIQTVVGTWDDRASETYG